MMESAEIRDEPGSIKSEVEKADVTAGVAVAKRRHHTRLKILGHLGELGDQGPLYLFGASVFSFGVMRKDNRCCAAGLAVLAAVGTADIIKTAVKKNVTRSRPKHSVEEGEYRFEEGGSRKKEEQSFPSGHTACTVAAAEAVVEFYPAAAKACRPVALLMTVSRLAKGHHWPIDLAAGAIIGKVSHVLGVRILAAFINLVLRARQ